MPEANPFAPLIEVGGGASAGPVSGKAGVSLSTGGEHHVSAGVVLLALGLLVLLWKSKFRFSTTVG